MTTSNLSFCIFFIFLSSSFSSDAFISPASSITLFFPAALLTEKPRNTDIMLTDITRSINFLNMSALKPEYPDALTAVFMFNLFSIIQSSYIQTKICNMINITAVIPKRYFRALHLSIGSSPTSFPVCPFMAKV